MNQKEVPETRSSLGLVQRYTQSGAFAEVYTPEEKDCELRLSYISNTAGKIETKTKDYNMSFGSVTLNTGGVFKRFNTNKIELAKSEEYALIQDFELTVKNSSENPINYMVLYNLAFNSPTEADMSTRLVINGEKQLMSNSFLGKVTDVGVSNGNVYALKAGDNKIQIDYKFSGESLTLSDTTDNKYSQSIIAFELPKDADVKLWKLEKPITLNTTNTWKPMGIDAKFNLATKKTAIIIYHINVKTDKKLFKARLRINNSFNKKSIILTEGMTYGYAHAYIVKVLKPGQYAFDLEYESDSTNTYSPELGDANAESIYLQMVLMD